MSSVQSADAAPAFQVERYQSKYRKHTSVIQVALVIIIAAGIALALVSNFGCIPRAFIYVGASLSIASVITLIVLKICRKNELSAALANAHTLSDFETILTGIKMRRHWYDYIENAICGESRIIEIYSLQLHGTVYVDTVIHHIENLNRRNPSALGTEFLQKFEDQVDDFIIS